MKNKNGIFYKCFSTVIKVLYYFNLVKLIKWVFALNQTDKEKIIQRKNIGIDIFNIFKFTLILLAIFLNWNSIWLITIILYLGLMNIFTYFYYHCWNLKPIRNIHHIRRRFFALSLSFIFNILVFTYLYKFLGTHHFDNFETNFLNAFQLSLANAFSSPAKASPVSLTAYYVVSIQLISTFIYVALLLSQSIPIFQEPKKEES